MTTPTDTAGHPDPDARDELASAYLDGETTAAENARVERDVDLLRRVEALAAVRDQLAAPSLAPDVADAQIAAALAAFDALPATAGGDDAAVGGADATVTDLAARRRRWVERVPLGAVAAVLAVVALVVGVSRLDLGTDADDMATGAAMEDAGDAADELGGTAELDASGGAASDADDGVESFDAGSAGGGDAAPAAGTLRTDDRASYADADELAAALRDRLDDDGPAEPGDVDGDTAGDTGAWSSDPCDAVAVAGVDPDTVRMVESVLLAGDPVTAVVFVDPDGTEQLALVDDASCQLQAQRPL